MKLAICIKVDATTKGTEIFQSQQLNAYALTLRAEVIGFSTINESILIEDLLFKIHRDLKKDFDSVLFMNKDAISLVFKEICFFVEECYRRGITVYTISDDNLTKQFKDVIRSNNEQTKQKFSQDTIDRMKRLASQGKFLGGRLPFGYTRELGVTKIDEGKAMIVREIFTLFGEGFSYKFIAMVLKEKHGLHYGDKGNWRAGKLFDMLINPLYNGYPTWNKTKQSEGNNSRNHEEAWVVSEKQNKELVIIDNDLWKTVQDRLNKLERA